MFPPVCPVCKSEFYGEANCSGDDSASRGSWVEERSDRPEKNPVRTSTPIAQSESSPSDSMDSVTDFFYQSWKNGLHSNDTSADRKFSERRECHPQPNLQPACHVPQIVYFDAVIYQAFAQYSYVQPVGYRPDGTFGVLPAYWGYLANF